MNDILNTEADEIYKSERVGLTTYKMRVPNGTYSLALLFAKNNNDLAGNRIFDVIAEGQLIQDNIDIFALAGKSTAYEIETELTVTDEKIDLYFPEEVDSAFINGIIVNQLTTDVEDEKSKKIFKIFQLNQNYPNPFNPVTNIGYTIPETGNVSLTVYDLLGKKVEVLVNEKQRKGNYSVAFYAKQYPSGVYFYKLTFIIF